MLGNVCAGVFLRIQFVFKFYLLISLSFSTIFAANSNFDWANAERDDAETVKQINISADFLDHCLSSSILRTHFDTLLDALVCQIDETPNFD